MNHHHQQRRRHDPPERGDPAVPPDVHGAGNADGSQRQHQDTQPGTVVPRRRAHRWAQAGHGRDDGAQPGVQDGPGIPGPSPLAKVTALLAVAVAGGRSSPADRRRHYGSSHRTLAGTSRTGLRSKKPSGRSLKPTVSTGMMGQSSSAGEVGQAEGVPHHDVLAVDVPVLRHIGRQARSAGVLVHEVAGGVPLLLGVPGDPQVLGGERGTAGDGGLRIRQQRGLVLGVELVAHRFAQPVARLRVGDDPCPAAPRIGLADGLGFAGQHRALPGEGVAALVTRRPWPAGPRPLPPHGW